MTSAWKESGKQYLHFFNSPEDQQRRVALDPMMLELAKPRNKRILDLGCGEGYFSRLMRSHGAREIIGIDASADLITAAKTKDPTGDYRLLDVTREELPDGNFDSVVANMVLHDLPDLRDVFRKISRSLVTQGTLVASVLNPYYAYPVGEWKRQIRNMLRGDMKPQLQIKNYFLPSEQTKTLPHTNTKVPHFHHQMSFYVNYASEFNLRLKTLLESATKEVPLYLILHYERV